jgi:uncharacterized protein (TIGR00156 family)
MKKYALLFACCFATLIAATTVSAQGFTGHGVNPPPPPSPEFGANGQYGFIGPVQTVTVAQARTFGHRTPVIISGNIIQAIGGDNYIFRDSSGEIILKIGPREWQYFGSTISPSDTIEISGEIHWPPRNWQNTPELHTRFMRRL